MVLDSISLFSHVGESSLSAPQAAGLFLSVLTITVRFVRCRQHSRQQPLEASSHELVSCGDGGNSVLWIPAAMLLLQFRLRIDFVSCVHLRLVSRLFLVLIVESVVPPCRILFLDVFFGSSCVGLEHRAPAPLCDHGLLDSYIFLRVNARTARTATTTVTGAAIRVVHSVLATISYAARTYRVRVCSYCNSQKVLFCCTDGYLEF